jgi:uncharacterized protein
MKTRLLAGLCAAALSLAACATAPAATAQTPVIAQAALPSGPALWRVADEDTTVWLFGTLHLLPEGQDWMTTPVAAAFNESATLRLELPSLDPTPEEAQRVLARGLAAPGSAPLTAGLDAAQKAALMEATAILGIPPQVADLMRPWFASMNVALALFQKLGISPDHGADKVLLARARAEGKAVEAFETLEQQIGFFADLPDGEALQALKVGLDQWATYEAEGTAMINAWREGDTAALEDLLNKGFDTTPLYRQVLLTNRNRAWATWIDARMDTPGTVFVAVGAGHLVGADSVQVFLAEQGHRAVQMQGKVADGR